MGDFERLRRHIGHKLECVCYSKGELIWNVSIECQDCGEIVYNVNNPEVQKLLLK